MRLEFKPQAFEDLQFWVQTNPKPAKRLLRLIEETRRDPFGGTGSSLNLHTPQIITPLELIKSAP